MTDNTKFSIITVCYDAQDYIEECIQSVIQQNYQNVEYIIIDGKSTDNTMNIINKYGDHIDKVISEKDSGIFDAMNKGFKLSNGDIIYFLNSDDKFYSPDVLSNIVKQFTLNGKVQILSGKVKYFNVPKNSRINYLRENFSFKTKRDLLSKQNPQQCIFARREVYNQIGFFDTNYKLCADYDWLLRAHNAQVNITCVEDIFAYSSCLGSTQTLHRTIFRETFKIIFKNSSLGDFLFYCSTYLQRKIKRTIFGRKALFESLK